MNLVITWLPSMHRMHLSDAARISVSLAELLNKEQTAGTTSQDRQHRL